VADDSVRIRQNGKQKTISIRSGIHSLDEIEVLEGLNESSEIVVPAEK
jgi:hypothetical protein